MDFGEDSKQSADLAKAVASVGQAISFGLILVAGGLFFNACSDESFPSTLRVDGVDVPRSQPATTLAPIGSNGSVLVADSYGQLFIVAPSGDVRALGGRPDQIIRKRRGIESGSGG